MSEWSDANICELRASITAMFGGGDEFILQVGNALVTPPLRVSMGGADCLPSVYFVDLVIKKIFILKLIYAFAFWLLLHKAGYIFGWFLSYIKEKPEYHGHHDHHHIEYGPPGPYRRGGQKPYNPYSSPSRKVNPY
ncbi:unnamed protein product [Spodoptera exigua]|nr:unnamed protein product [Spodoptera exigua]